jgi:ketosteroid isomerase-like protein
VAGREGAGAGIAASPNVEVVRRFYQRAGLGDWSVLELLFEDLEYRPIAEIVGSGEYRGREGFRGYVEDFETAWSDEHGDSVISRVELRGHGRTSGLELATRVFQVFTLRDGKIVRLEDFVDRAEALAAVGR